MSVAAEQERVAGVQPYRFTVDEFARMGEARRGDQVVSTSAPEFGVPVDDTFGA